MARLIDADELISKKQLLTDLRANYEYGAIDIVEAQPTIDPAKQEWISAKVRPPKVGEKVLVYWDDGFEIGSYIGGEVGEGVYWMPLPEPPKDGE